MDNNSINLNALNIAEPLNLLLFMSFFSPIILISLIVSLSFIFQNVKGFVYLGFIIGSLVLREFFLKYSGFKQFQFDTNNRLCTSVKFSNFSNSTFNLFVFCFTFMYLCLPMFINNDINFFIVFMLLGYTIIDVAIKYYKRCFLEFTNLFIDSLSGLALGSLIVLLMYSGCSSKYLFFNEISSSIEQCSVPSKQTFKCSVYKNGQLVDHKTM